jgi:hypothetical protein
VPAVILFPKRDERKEKKEKPKDKTRAKRTKEETVQSHAFVKGFRLV